MQQVQQPTGPLGSYFTFVTATGTNEFLTNLVTTTHTGTNEFLTNIKATTITGQFYGSTLTLSSTIDSGTNNTRFINPPSSWRSGLEKMFFGVQDANTDMTISNSSVDVASLGILNNLDNYSLHIGRILFNGQETLIIYSEQVV